LCQPVIDQRAQENLINYAWVIKTVESREFVGQIGFNVSTAKYNKDEVFFSLLQAFWGQGFAAEWAMAVFKFAFENLNLHRLEAEVAVTNSKSIALLERLGMQREGLHRKILPLNLSSA